VPRPSGHTHIFLQVTIVSTHSKLDIAFIGGGNMASAIIGGLLKSGTPAQHILVVEPSPEQRAKLAQDFSITALPQAGAELAAAQLVVWAVKPQLFKQAAAPCAAHTANALHLSVAAGIGSGSIAAWLGSERVVRAMPNTPALVGQGMTGLFARAGVSAQERALVERVLAPTGELVWLTQEEQLDAVTALSGSGPAYVFYFIEAMVRAGQDMGLSEAQAAQLAKATFSGASALAKSSSEAPQVLRERVTSKGGTTYAAITSLQQAQVAEAFARAMHAARARAAELGREFGA
jgi:pyrroline-5-carboxylate reductase